MPGYGRMLTHTAQYIDVSGDASLLGEIQPHLDAVVALVRRKLNASRTLPADDIAHGILLGCDSRIKSDCHFVVQLNHFVSGFLSYSVAVFLK